MEFVELFLRQHLLEGVDAFGRDADPVSLCASIAVRVSFEEVEGYVVGFQGARQQGATYTGAGDEDWFGRHRSLLFRCCVKTSRD